MARPARSICGRVNQRQQQIIEFQNAQIEALLKKLGRKRLLLDNAQRRLLAVKAHAIGRKALLELTTIVTPDTILRWHHGLHDRRSLDAEWSDHVLRSRRDAPEDTTCAHWRDHAESECHVDETGLQEPDSH